MKRFNDFLTEDLNGALVEPKSASSQEAARLGLAYVGFGRYEDPKTQQITHIVQNDRLIPFNKAIKTNSFKKISGDDYGEYFNNQKSTTEDYHNYLSGAYLPENYDENELAAIEMYTDTAYSSVNDMLNSLPTGIPANQIQAQSVDDNLPSIVQSLDSALEKSSTPIDFVSFVSLNSGYNITDFKAGQTFRFKGFRSVTIDPNVALNFATKDDNNPRKKQAIILQVSVKKGSKGMYLDDFSANPGEAEFLLPRGSSVKIVDGPNKLVGSNAYTNDMNQQVVFFNAELVKNK